ncbi:hypothetical protein [Pseudomonas aeruginosa]|uniref:hypothetical protein n=1 Tax=Pseudomonas aeruginosa TaxID=287 RepID=UPI00068AE108|nr:hypothetical protein [Pseudomonas aeruginosa]
MQDIQDRFRAVIRHNTSDTRRYAELEALTGIPAASWNKAYNERQRPTAEMLQAIARQWPEYAFWLITGVTDARYGHISCRDGIRREFYPERRFGRRGTAQLYFTHLIEMFRRKYGDKSLYPLESMEREAAATLIQLEMSRRAEDQALDPDESVAEKYRAAEAAALEAKASEQNEPGVTRENEQT